MDIEQSYQDQLIELEKQGRKAARYRSVGDRLRKAEATLFLTLLNTAEREFNDFKKTFTLPTDVNDFIKNGVALGSLRCHVGTTFCI